MTVLMIEARHILATGRNIHLREDMLRNRADIFGRVLKWVDPEEEVHGDQWDEAGPVYLIAVDDAGAYRGSLRLLPTTGPNMLRDVFPDLLSHYCPVCRGNGEIESGTFYGFVQCDWCRGAGFERDTVESATIWESSRIVTADRSVRTFAELMQGIAEVSVIAGLTQVVTVVDARVRRVLDSVGYSYGVLADPKMVGRALTSVIVFDVDPLQMPRFREATGFQEPVLEVFDNG